MSESTPEDHTLEASAASDPVLPDTLDELLALGREYSALYERQLLEEELENA